MIQYSGSVIERARKGSLAGPGGLAGAAQWGGKARSTRKKEHTNLTNAHNLRMQMKLFLMGVLQTEMKALAT